MAQSNHIRDREKDKFDSDGNVKVSIESNNATAQDQDVVVKNTSSEPVPVSIVNPDANIDLEVTVSPSVTIDDSTPIDVNVTNSSVNTNATIQGTPAVTISGNVDIDDATAIRVDVTNASIATAATIQNASLNTNATIQNSELDVNVTNMHLHVYDMLYNGSSWVNQLSDSSGRAIVLNKLHYRAADITALGSSTLVREWLSAYADGILEYKYVGSYDDEFEQEVYLTHPDLGNSNKCLKLIYSYSTENSQKVVKSVYAAVVDWTFDANVTGALTITLGTINSPNPSSAIAVGTDICTIAVANTGSGTVNISLSGTNASLYTLRNVTDGTTGSDLLYDAAKSFVLETASDFSGSSYSHSVTITATNNFFGNTASENVATSGTFTVSTFSNLKAATTSGTDLATSYVQLNNGSNITNVLSSDWSVSFWLKSDSDLSTGTIASGSPSYAYELQIMGGGYESQNYVAGFYINIRGNNLNVGFAKDAGPTTNLSEYWLKRYDDIRTDLYDGNWHHVAIVHNGSGTATSSLATFNTNVTVYFDGSAKTVTHTFSGGTDSSIVTQASKLIFGKQPADDNTNSNFTNAPTVFRDEVDELAYWSGHDLTSSEVTAIYNSGTPTNLESTTGVTVPTEYYRFEETDLGYESIADANTANENNIQAVTLDGGDSIYLSGIQNLSAATTSGTDTADSYISFNNGNNITNIWSTDWSVSFWLKSDSDLSSGTISTGSPSYSYELQIMGGGYDSQNYNAGFFVNIRENDLRIGATADAGEFLSAADWWVLTFSDVRAIYDGNWHHVVIVHNGSGTSTSSISTLNTNISLYFDGSAQSSSSTYTLGTDSNIVNQPSKLLFGKQPVDDRQVNNVTYPTVFRDEIDEVAYWSSHDLTSSEVTAIYNGGTPTDLESTTGVTVPSEYYRFEETDLGYDEITDANTSNENNIQVVTLDSSDGIYSS